MPHKWNFDEPPAGECVDCDRPFWLTEGERRFFEREGLMPPKRCVACRERKRQANARRGEGRPPLVDMGAGRAHSRRDGGRAGNASRRL